MDTTGRHVNWPRAQNQSGVSRYSAFCCAVAGFKINKLMTSDMRIVLEKPIGHDFVSAKAINDQVGACFEENQIFALTTI